MSEKLITVKSVSLNNNCPECFNKEGLELTFKQRFIETKLYKSITQDISTQMFCNTCNTEIYPVRWTEDIERVYNYQMKAFKPKKASKKYKSLFWIILGIVAVLLLTAGVLGFINLPE
ncbi:hypothetical protein CLV86_1107 [Lacinutrix venerupis]|uniref:hypothetical protein n=1 Tax=Lacinutrix venerupis TaxID=1486034 RepID=UPI000EB24FD8|nr:hypothetical protein [Lacinutrix venerupis]RLJ65531.1 hypothetical protein CLV86_1107 [Lacinutrix venerupis]